MEVRENLAEALYQSFFGTHQKLSSAPMALQRSFRHAAVVAFEEIVADIEKAGGPALER